MRIAAHAIPEHFRVNRSAPRLRRFERFPKVQVIDLDAAMDAGDNLPVVRQIAASLACRVGGGIRTIERAQDLLEAGARQVIVGSALFKDGALPTLAPETLCRLKVPLEEMQHELFHATL